MRFTPPFLSANQIGYVLATLGVALLTVVSLPLVGHVDPGNMVMLYLLLVVGVALRFTRGAAAWCALCGVIAFDVFHVAPRFSLAVSDVQYLLTFAVMLLVGLLLAHLTARLRGQAAAAAENEAATRRQYDLARELAGCIDEMQACDAVARFVRREFAGNASIWWLSKDESLHCLSGSCAADDGVLRSVIETALIEGRTRQLQDPRDADRHLFLLPLDAPMRRRGVLLLNVPQANLLELSLGRVETLGPLVAIALERLHYVRIAQQATLEMERERLRSTLLSALSHDIRTPLTVLVGQADALVSTNATGVRELARAIREQAMRMSELVNNLLEMASLQSGRMQLRRNWESLEEIVGAATAHLGERLNRHQLAIELPPDLPLLEFDAVLIERVLCNLIENAVKYSPPGGKIRVSAQLLASELEVLLEDEGPGLSDSTLQHLFEPFVRGESVSAVPGLGLGLSICRIIVEAHGGRLQGGNRNGGGARFAFTLPLSDQPSVAAEVEVDDAR